MHGKTNVKKFIYQLFQ